MSGQLLSVGMLQYSRYCFVGKSSGIATITIGLQFHCCVDKAVYGSLCQWESHSDIDVLHFLRNGVEYRKQQCFVTEYYCIFFFFTFTVREGCTYPFGKEARLCIFGRSGNVAYIFGCFERVEITIRKLVREIL